MLIDIKKYLDEKRKKDPNVAFAKIFFLGSAQILCNGKMIPTQIIEMESCSSEQLEYISKNPKLGLDNVDLIKQDHDLVCIIQYRKR